MQFCCFNACRKQKLLQEMLRYAVYSSNNGKQFASFGIMFGFFPQDVSKGLYGKLPLVQSQEKTGYLPVHVYV